MARKYERNPQSLAKFFSENQTFTAFFEDDLFRSKLSTERLLQQHLLPFSGTSTTWSPQRPEFYWAELQIAAMFYACFTQTNGICINAKPPTICRFNFAIKPAKQIGMCLKFAENTTLWSLVSASLCCYLCLFLFLFLCSFHLTLSGILKDTFFCWSPSGDIPERSSHQHDLG